MLRGTVIACPHCGKEHDCRSPIDEVEMEPEDGDISFCIDCGNFGAFKGTKLVKPNKEQQEFVEADPDCVKMVKVWQQLKARN